MVTGLNVFRDYFADDTDKYVLIGGAACDIVFTKDICRLWDTHRFGKQITLETLSP